MASAIRTPRAGRPPARVPLGKGARQRIRGDVGGQRGRGVERGAGPSCVESVDLQGAPQRRPERRGHAATPGARGRSATPRGGERRHDTGGGRHRGRSNHCRSSHGRRGRRRSEIPLRSTRRRGRPPLPYRASANPPERGPPPAVRDRRRASDRAPFRGDRRRRRGDQPARRKSSAVTATVNVASRPSYRPDASRRAPSVPPPSTDGCRGPHR